MLRPQFRLRTLLIALTACAALVWALAIGWPRWSLYREQADFEQSLQQLQAGTTPKAGSNLVRYKTCYTRMMATGNTSAGEPVVFSVYSWPNACYCICYVLANPSSGDFTVRPTSRIEVYRLPPAPPDNKSPKISGGHPTTNYVWDSQAKMFGSGQDSSDERAVLIYSDD
jgi:hypothetical protein